MKKITKQKKIIMTSALAFVTVLFYSQWEIPTLLYGREFNNQKIVDHVTYETGSMLSKPDFIKVIYYDAKEADILWVKGREQVVVKMNRVESKAGKSEWMYYTWITCTPANGSSRCFFPWYGGFPSI